MTDTQDVLVYVVDDDASLRRSLGRLLRSAGYRAELFSSAVEFLGRPLDAVPSCIILDVKMPGVSGPELQEKLRAVDSTLPVVFLSGHATVPTSVHAMKLGAVDFLMKPVDDQILLDAVARSLEHSRQMRMTTAIRSSILSRIATLTPRELDVMQHVVTGALNKQIADVLGIVEKTVKVHRAQVMRKMGVQSVAELSRLWERVNGSLQKQSFPEDPKPLVQ